MSGKCCNKEKGLPLLSNLGMAPYLMDAQASEKKKTQYKLILNVSSPTYIVGFSLTSSDAWNLEKMNLTTIFMK